MPAARALSAALEANDNDSPKDAITNARIASRLFAKSHNVAGDLWSRFAEVYAYQRQQSGAACLDAIAKLGVRLENTTYHWLQGQLALEKAMCRNFTGDFSEADINADLRNSTDIAMRFGFPILHFRILGIAPGIRRQQSKTCEETWGAVLDGLEEYWKGVFPRERLYQFYSVLAQCAEQEGHWNEAKALIDWTIEMRLAMNMKSQDSKVLGSLYLHLASILTSLRDNAGAERAAAQAEAMFEKVPGPNQFKLITRIMLAECQLELGKAEDSLATLESARGLLESTDNRLVLMDFRRVMGKIHLQLGQWTDAEQEYKFGIEIAESSLSTLKHADQRIEWVAKTEELYRGLVQIWLEQNRPVDAWKLWEWSKTRSMYQGHPSRDSRPSALAWQELQKKILSLPVPREPSVRVVYAVFANRLHVWTVGRGLIRSRWIEVKRAKLEDLIGDFVKKCANKNSALSELNKQGKALFVLLVQPFIDELSATQAVAFEVDQQLWNLPIQALRTPDGHYLAEIMKMGYSPGIRVEHMLRKAGRIQRENALLLVEALPGFGPELPAISGRFLRPALLDGATPESKAQVLDVIKRSNILFFFGHAIPSGRGAVLKLNDDASLSALDFPPETLSRLSLTVLAACSTGSTGDRGLLDTHSLIHAFLAGKVPDVVVSQWDVDSDKTAELMDNFFQNGLKGEPVGWAATNAQRDYLDSHPQEQDRHPYYWAGFIVVGRTD
jgi:CHAT domain-containing protein